MTTCGKETEMMDRPACLECKFKHGIECYRYPPTGNGNYPRIQSYDWCGEFQPKEPHP